MAAPYDPERARRELAETPLRIAALVAGRSGEQLARAPAPGEWSVVDILAHLRACADVWGGNIHALAAGRDTSLRTTDPRAWVEHTPYRTQTARGSLRSLTRQRAELLACLDRLDARAWRRRVVVLTWGQRYPRTVLYYAERLATHERSHLRHLARLVSTFTQD